jgi:phage terminase large subunit
MAEFKDIKRKHSEKTKSVGFLSRFILYYELNYYYKRYGRKKVIADKEKSDLL